jgi:hypothetical protein
MRFKSRFSHFKPRKKLDAMDRAELRNQPRRSAHARIPPI